VIWIGLGDGLAYEMDLLMGWIGLVYALAYDMD
jgi:hypothetical protein